MSLGSIWDETQMGILDRENQFVDYKGAKLDGDCFIALSTFSFVLFSAIVDHQNPIGFFTVKSSIITNVIEYANGGILQGDFVRSFLCPVYKFEDKFFILIEAECPKPNQFVEKIVSILNPRHITVFFSESTSQNLNNSKENSENIQIRCHVFPSKDTFFALPFRFSGFPAGIITLCPIHNIDYQLFYIENESLESSYDNIFSVIISELEKLLKIDSSAIIQKAVSIMNERKATEKMILL